MKKYINFKKIVVFILIFIFLFFCNHSILYAEEVDSINRIFENQSLVFKGYIQRKTGTNYSLSSSTLTGGTFTSTNPRLVNTSFSELNTYSYAFTGFRFDLDTFKFYKDKYYDVDIYIKYNSNVVVENTELLDILTNPRDENDCDSTGNNCYNRDLIKTTSDNLKLTTFTISHNVDYPYTSEEVETDFVKISLTFKAIEDVSGASVYFGVTDDSQIEQPSSCSSFPCYEDNFWFFYYNRTVSFNFIVATPVIIEYSGDPTEPSIEDRMSIAIQNVLNKIYNPNSDETFGVLGGYFSNFKDNDFGLSDIIIAPLNLIKSLTTATCSQVVLPLPYVDKDIYLPCLTPIYYEYFGDFFELYQLIMHGLVCYYVLIHLFAMAKGFRDPDDDKIEVLAL